jgi:rod shape determining protein RodA
MTVVPVRRAKPLVASEATMKANLWTRRLPWSLVGAAVLLVVLGWLGIARSEELARGTGRYLRHQIVWSGVGLAAMLLVPVVSYRAIGRWSYGIFAGVLGLLVLVYLFPPVHGVHRWIRLWGLSLQPSEFAKPAFVLMLARYLMYRENCRTFRGLLTPLALAIVPLLLILREPDLGTSLVFLPVLYIMLFAAGARTVDLAKIAICGLAFLPLLWSEMSGEQKSRVTALFAQNLPQEKPTAEGYQLHQAKQLLALGGVTGSFFSGDAIEDRAAYHLPESHTDFIFTVIGERFGWFGLAAVLLLFVILVSRAVAVADETREPFGRLIAVGVAALFGTQVIINTAMTVGLLPITGLSLPLVSYGGSGTLAHGLALGLLLNVGLRPGYEITQEPFRFAGNKKSAHRPAKLLRAAVR